MVTRATLTSQLRAQDTTQLSVPLLPEQKKTGISKSKLFEQLQERYSECPPIDYSDQTQVFDFNVAGMGDSELHYYWSMNTPLELVRLKAEGYVKVDSDHFIGLPSEGIDLYIPNAGADPVTQKPFDLQLYACLKHVYENKMRKHSGLNVNQTIKDRSMLARERVDKGVEGVFKMEEA